MKKDNLANIPSPVCEHAVKEHTHIHAANCGHRSFVHAGHICYLHDGHYHYMHDGHAHECPGPQAQPFAPRSSSAPTGGKQGKVLAFDRKKKK